MIIAKIQGGLGNQLFQWAYSRNLSKNNETFLDISLYTNNEEKREFGLDKFSNINYSINTHSLYNSVLVHDYFRYTNVTFYATHLYYLNGYWQSEKYFKESEDIIRKDLEPSDEQFLKLNATPFINDNVVSMHIRRTDYTTSNGYHPVQTVEYYKKALEIIGEYDKLFIFSDDIEWCRNNLKFDNMIFIEGNTDIEDLYLISLCKHNIIANSSFSWWGAWLNKNPNKKVIAPSKWFGDMANLNESDIVPEGWIRI